MSLPNRLCVAILALAACREGTPAPQRAGAGAGPSAVARAAGPSAARSDTTGLDADTGEVKAAGAVLVAAFVATRAQVDSNADMNETLSDFEFYLPGVADSLRARGVRVAVRFARPVRINAAGRQLEWAVSQDSGGVGYLLLAPGKPPRTLWGVQTDIDLLGAADTYFAQVAAGAAPR
jgi:hypothetical protein